MRQQLAQARPATVGQAAPHAGRHAGGRLDTAGASEEAQPRGAQLAWHEADFIAQLAAAWQRNDSLVCVGLDPEPERLPASLAGEAMPIFEFNKAIIDATADLVCAYKPQFAHYAAHGAEEQLERTIEYIHEQHPHVPVILDSKRGDVGNTAERYAHRGIRAIRRRCGDRQSLSGRRFARAVSEARGQGRHHPVPHLQSGRARRAGLEVGGRGCITPSPNWRRSTGIRAATACWWWGRRIRESWPKCAQIVGDMPLLVPGVGAQGGDVAQVVRNGQTATGTGLVISSSRAILYASSGAEFADAARKATATLREQINASRAEPVTSTPMLRQSLPSCCWRRWLALLAGCSRDSRRPRESSARAVDTRVLLRGNGAEPDSLDPQKARSNESQTILRDLCEGLTSLAKDASVAPGVARDWEVSEDGRTYTFHLRPEARWSNGDRVVAADFVAALRRLVDPATASQYAQVVEVIANAPEIIRGRKPPDTLGVSAPDDATVVIQLNAPAPYVPGLLSHPEHLSRASADARRACRDALAARRRWCPTARSC